MSHLIFNRDKTRFAISTSVVSGVFACPPEVGEAFAAFTTGRRLKGVSLPEGVARLALDANQTIDACLLGDADPLAIEAARAAGATEGCPAVWLEPCESGEGAVPRSTSLIRDINDRLVAVTR